MIALDFPDEASLAAFGTALAARLRVGDLVALEGPLGVGKTTLSRAIIAALGHDGDVPSPTFAIVQPYEETAVPLWHVDLYRLDDPDEIHELGLSDARSDHALLVEWPAKGGVDRWPDALQIVLEFAPGGGRRLTASLPSGWTEQWP